MDKVYVVGGNRAISEMFRQRGWETVDNDYDATLICFTGGADVSPMLYGETREPRTYCEPERDQRESDVYLRNLGNRPMVGICRGAQFLNVMNGGKLHQHVEGHTRNHMAWCHLQQKDIEVTSTHHQQMIKGATGNLLMYVWDHPEYQAECVMYYHTLTMCYQPHPEYVDSDHECQETFFLYLNELLMNKGKG